MQTTIAIRTAHKPDCQMAFGRKDPSCPRCQELLAGAQPIKWAWAEQAKKDRARAAFAPRTRHVCRPGSCSSVCCTHGDW